MLGTPLAFSSSATLMSRGAIRTCVGWWLAWVLGIFGIVLLLVGGFISKPRFLWLGAIMLGLAYISSFYGLILDSLGKNGMRGLILVLVPSIACIIGG